MFTSPEGFLNSVPELSCLCFALKGNESNACTFPAGNFFNKGGDGAGYRAALLSGPPGIGKTTTATLVCKVGRKSKMPPFDTFVGDF